MQNVLLIENNSSLAKVYAHALEHAGFSVVAKADAEQAIHAADDQAPSVVVLELQLSGRNGLEFLQEFRSYSDWQNIPIIIHTMVKPEVMSKAVHALERDFDVKDILYKSRTSLQDLVNIVRSRLLQ
jgi:DNA-binding response OmpR family regulator